MERRVCIVGVGLIGGSLALAWKERRTDLHITGWDRPDVLDTALHRGIIDEAAGSLAGAVHNADIVVLSVPLGAMETVLRPLAEQARPGTIVTDVGSVKVEVMNLASRLLPAKVPFIGGHPMAGTQHTGLAYADAFLFENATYVLCGDDRSSAYHTVAELVESTGAHVLRLGAARHDRIAAGVSHLPQLIATTLMNVVARHGRSDAAYWQLAAGGFRDMTRIASSPFTIWQTTLEHNHRALAEICQEFQVAWQAVIARVRCGKGNGIVALETQFELARALRARIPKDSKGFLAPLCDIFVYAEDRPGALAHITATLFAQEINIKDIELLKVREGTGGAFRISFADEPAANAAIAALNAAGCRAHRLT